MQRGVRPVDILSVRWGDAVRPGTAHSHFANVAKTLKHLQNVTGKYKRKYPDGACTVISLGTLTSVTSGPIIVSVSAGPKL